MSKTKDIGSNRSGDVGLTASNLRGRAILVVEDEYMLADDLRRQLTAQSIQVIGPAATVQQGWAYLETCERLDGAILDVNLRGEDVFDLAAGLIARNIPFVFLTGYDASAIPERFRHLSRCEKPVEIAKVLDALSRAAGG